MPMLQTDPAKKFTCKNCGWSIIRPAYTHGDAIGPTELLYKQDVTQCPKCKSNDITASYPNALESLNPFGRNDWGEWLESESMFQRPKF